MKILEVKNLTKIYGNNENSVKALDDISFSVEKGEFLSIIGASGSGKSTLLHILGGIEKPSSGTIFVNNKDIGTLTDSQLAIYRRRTPQLIFQFYNLIPILNVKENILLPILLDYKNPDDARLKNLISLLGLQDKENSLPNQLSGGQQQRVAIGRCLMANPSIVLADEPTGNLDTLNSNEIITLLKEYNTKFQQTILLVTHDIKIAKQTNRILTLQDGKIIKDEVQIHE